MTLENPKAFLRELFDAAVAAADPARVIPPSPYDSDGARMRG